MLAATMMKCMQVMKVTCTGASMHGKNEGLGHIAPQAAQACHQATP